MSYCNEKRLCKNVEYKNLSRKEGINVDHLDADYTPTNFYESERNLEFLQNPLMHKKVRDMAFYRYRNENPGQQIIIYPDDVKEAMYYVTDSQFTQTENIHNLAISASKHLYDILLENYYNETELNGQYDNVKRRVHEYTDTPRISSTHLKQKFSYDISSNVS